MICVSGNDWAIEHVDESIQYDKDILKAAFASCCQIYKVLNSEILKSLYKTKELKSIMDDQYQYLD